MEEPPRIVIWKALMLEVMKRVEEAISREKQDPASYEATLSLGIAQEYQQGQKVRMLPTEAATTVTHCWPYVTWDAASNKLIPDSSRDPLSTNASLLLQSFRTAIYYVSAPPAGNRQLWPDQCLRLDAFWSSLGTSVGITRSISPWPAHDS